MGFTKFYVIFTKTSEAPPFMSIVRRLIPRIGGAETRTFRVGVADVLNTRRAACPACRAGELVASQIDTGARVCLTCGEVFPLEVLRRTIVVDEETATRLAASARREALICFVTADLVAVGSAIWAVTVGGWPTLIGGTALCAGLLAFAASTRYRAWQVENRRLFESRPPFLDWLRAELGAK